LGLTRTPTELISPQAELSRHALPPKYSESLLRGVPLTAA
jgi:hypothetical protein